MTLAGRRAIRSWLQAASYSVGCKVGRRHSGILRTRDSEGRQGVACENTGTAKGKGRGSKYER